MKVKHEWGTDLGVAIVCMVVAIVLVILSLGCYKGKKCEYRDWCSCELLTDGDRRYFTIVVRGCDLCCFHSLPFLEADYTEFEKDELKKKFYWQALEKKPHCATIEGEDCGVTTEWGKIIE